MSEFTEGTKTTTTISTISSDGTTEIVEETEEVSLSKISDFKSSITYDDFEIVEIVKPPPMVRKGTYVFSIEIMESNEVDKFTRAAINIERCARGFLARRKVLHKLRAIPHCIDFKLDFASDLPLNNDIFSSKPDVFCIANTFSEKKLKRGLVELCDSTFTTKVKVANQNPYFNQDMMIATGGYGKIVINVMSQHTLTTPSLLGQAVIYTSKYTELLKGGMRRFLIPLKQKTMPIYDNKGKEMHTGDAHNPTGWVSVSLTIPTVYNNMCGWFWNIHDYVNGFGYADITGDKIWVVVKNKIIRVYDTPYDMSKAIMTFSAYDVLDLVETTYDKLEIALQGVKLIVEEDDPINVGTRSPKEYMWAWGDDAASLKGLWRRAFILNRYAPSILAEEKKVAASVKVIRKEVEVDPLELERIRLERIKLESGGDSGYSVTTTTTTTTTSDPVEYEYSSTTTTTTTTSTSESSSSSSFVSSSSSTSYSSSTITTS